MDAQAQEIMKTNISHLFRNSSNFNFEAMIRGLQIGNCYTGKWSLGYKEYVFDDGPFKGQKFISTAQERFWLDKFRSLVVIFVDGPFKGFKTDSTICFGRRISAKKTEQWSGVSMKVKNPTFKLAF